MDKGKRRTKWTIRHLLLAAQLRVRYLSRIGNCAAAAATKLPAKIASRILRIFGLLGTTRVLGTSGMFGPMLSHQHLADGDHDWINKSASH